MQSLTHVTFDRETCAELLAQSQPKAIVNNRENKKAIALAEELSHRPMRSPEQDARRTQFVHCAVGCRVRAHLITPNAMHYNKVTSGKEMSHDHLTHSN